jgi:hypothetical protein
MKSVPKIAAKSMAQFFLLPCLLAVSALLCSCPEPPKKPIPPLDPSKATKKEKPAEAPAAPTSPGQVSRMPLGDLYQLVQGKAAVIYDGDAVVGGGAEIRFLHPRGLAPQVGDSRGPHLLPLDGRQKMDVGEREPAAAGHAWRNLANLSPVVRSLAHEQFDNLVKRVRVFAPPDEAEAIAGCPDLESLLVAAARD